MHVNTVVWDQLINTIMHFQTGQNEKYWNFARRYLLCSFFQKFLQINNNILYLLAAQKIIFSLKFLCASHLKIKHFELPPAYKLNI